MIDQTSLTLLYWTASTAILVCIALIIMYFILDRQYAAYRMKNTRGRRVASRRHGDRRSYDRRLPSIGPGEEPRQPDGWDKTFPTT